MLVDGGGARLLGQFPWSNPSGASPQTADFRTLLYGPAGAPRIVLAKDPGSPDLSPLTARGPETGIKIFVVEPGGPWPYQMYRDTPFGYETNDQLRAQRAATPQLDLNPFGNRPGASEWADYSLQAGDKIIVLDEVRLGYLEEQRELLDDVMPSASTDSQA